MKSPEHEIMGTAVELHRVKAIQPTESAPIHIAHGITLELPEHIAEIDDAPNVGVPPTEHSNQKRLFAIREFIAQQEGGEEFTWLPQAIEAFLRSQRSNLLPDIGRARGISIRPDRGTVTFMTINKDGISAPFDLRMAELRPYSLELTLVEAEAEKVLPPIGYSAGMTEAIAKLSPDAQFRWDLITRAARLNDEKILVKAVTSDRLSGAAEGVGVFVKNGRSDEDNWSLGKVTFGDLPLTDKEKKLLDGVRTIYKPEKQDPTLQKFTDFVWQLVTELQDRHNLKAGSNTDWAQKAQYHWKRFWGNDLSLIMAHELTTLTGTLLEVQQNNFNIMSQVQELIMRNKSAFSATAPFETSVLSPELQTAMETGASKMATVLRELITLMRKAQADLLPLLEQAGPVQHPGNSSTDHFSEERYTKILAGLKEFSEGDLSSRIKGLLE